MNDKAKMMMQEKLMDTCGTDLLLCFMMKLAAKCLNDEEITEVFEMFAMRATDSILSSEDLSPTVRVFIRDWVKMFIENQGEEIAEMIEANRTQERRGG